MSRKTRRFVLDDIDILHEGTTYALVFRGHRKVDERYRASLTETIRVSGISRSKVELLRSRLEIALKEEPARGAARSGDAVAGAEG